MTRKTGNGDICMTTLSRRERRFYLADGDTLDIVAMLDDRGNAVNANAATIGIYELECDGFYRGVDLRLFRDDLGNEPIVSTAPTISCTAVNKRDRYFRLVDGDRLDISTTLDRELRPTICPDAMTVGIFQLPDGCYRGVDLRQIDEEILQ